MRDLVNNVKVTKAKATGQATATGNGGVVIDSQGFQSLMFAVLLSAVAAADGDNTLTFGVEEGDASDGSDLVAIADTDRLIGAAVVNATTDDEKTLKLGVSIGVKRYFRLTFTEVGTVDATFDAVAILGHPNHAPVAAEA